MDVIKIREKLLKKISSTNDEELLEDIFQLLEDESTNKVYYLSSEQLNLIAEAEQQLNRGESYTDEEAQKITNQWLDEYGRN